MRTGRPPIHGHTKYNGWRSKTYKAWDSMKQRCLNPNNSRFKDYGAKGITICKRWLNSFINFLFDMGEAPLNTSLDRIKNNGNYTPRNCRWATLSQQNKNRNFPHYSWISKIGICKRWYINRGKPCICGKHGGY
jgi:hypothetical protein